MAWTRASQLDRTLQCPGHLTLSHTRVMSANAQASADYGTMVHHWAATGEINGVGEEGASHEKTFAKKLDVLTAAGITRQDIWPHSGHAYQEVSFAYNCLDHRLGVHWGYKNSNAWKQTYEEPWVTGTTDYVANVDGILWVDDLKTGMMFDSQPEDMGQMFLYSLCWSKYWRLEQDVRVSITHWPKYPLQALPVRTENVITWKRLKKFDDYLCDLYVKHRDGKDVFALGAECEYCPAIENCPLQRKDKI